MRQLIANRNKPGGGRKNPVHIKQNYALSTTASVFSPSSNYQLWATNPLTDANILSSAAAATGMDEDGGISSGGDSSDDFYENYVSYYCGSSGLINVSII